MSDSTFKPAKWYVVQFIRSDGPHTIYPTNWHRMIPIPRIGESIISFALRKNESESGHFRIVKIAYPIGEIMCETLMVNIYVTPESHYT